MGFTDTWNKYTSIYDNNKTLFDKFFQPLSDITGIVDFKNSNYGSYDSSGNPVTSPSTYASQKPVKQDEALGVIELNVSRQNRFDVTVYLPSLTELSKYSNKNMNFYIQDSSLPSQTLRLTETMHQGIERYAIINKTTDFIILRFYDTREQIFRNTFLAWQTAIVPINEHKALKYYPSEYQSKIGITIHETKYMLEGVVPITVGDFVLSHTATNTLGTFDVTFKVKKCSLV